MMLSCEALEDNETILIENARKTTRLDKHKNLPKFELLEEPQEVCSNLNPKQMNVSMQL